MATEDFADSDQRIRAALLASGALVAPVVVGALDAVRVDAVGFVPAFLATTTSVVEGCGPTLAVSVLLALPELLVQFDRRASVGLQAILALGLAAVLHAGLADDTVLASHPGTLAGLGAFVVVMGTEIAVRQRRAIVDWIVATGAFVAGIAIWAANYEVGVGGYAEAHWALLNVAALGIAFGSGRLLALAAALLPRSRRWSVAGGLIGALAIANATAFVGESREALVHVAADTESGRARIYVNGPIERATTMVEVRANAELHASRPFDVPQRFDLEDWDILFVASEAIRWDDTSLHRPKLKTTPNMVKWRERGAMHFERAYSPSAGTMLSLASWFTMKPPSCAGLDLYKPNWAGVLRKEAQTVAELLSAQGRHTFWIGHNFRDLFDRKVFGLEQGFEHIERTSELNKKVSVYADTRTGDAAVKHIGSLKPDQRFFGFVMFSSPHYSYIKHYDDMPSKSARQRYRQEIRKADEQFGRVMQALQQAGRLDKTIVIVTADHGEEFKDHGQTGHSRAVWEESIRVPLLVWFPGATATRPKQPVMTATLLPRLLGYSGGEARAAVDEITATIWDPLLAATNKAAIAEHIRGQGSQIAFVWKDRKLITDVASNRSYAIDLAKDPREKNKRFELSPEEQKIIDGYFTVREGCENFVDTGKRPPD